MKNWNDIKNGLSMSQKVLDKGFNFKYENIESAINDLAKKIYP